MTMINVGFILCAVGVILVVIGLIHVTRTFTVYYVEDFRDGEWVDDGPFGGVAMCPQCNGETKNGKCTAQCDREEKL